MKAKKNLTGKRVASDYLLKRIEDIVSEAYEIGHDHGGNAMRMALRQPPLSLNKGWNTAAKKLLRLFKLHSVLV
jgi:hypothetical protein